MSVLALVAATLALTGSPAAAGPPGDPTTLLAPMAGVHIETTQVSPDGETVVFLADLDSNDQFAAYSVPTDGSAPPVRISGSHVAGGDVTQIRISPDSSRVILRGDLVFNDQSQLFSVPIGGGSRQVVSHAGAPLPSVTTSFEVTADSARVVFRSSPGLGGINVYSVPIDGGVPTRLNDLLPAGSNVSNFEITPDSDDVVFRADMETPGDIQLYVVPVEGGTPTRISGAQGGGFVIIPHRDVVSYDISPDSAWVVYRAEEIIGNDHNLFAASTAGLGDDPVRLNGSMPPDGTCGGAEALSSS